MSTPDREWWLPELLDRDAWRDLVEGVLGSLDRARRRQALPHAMLIVGPAGLGREAVAVETAAWLTCPQESPGGCTCPSCERVRRGIHPDVERVAAQERSRQIRIPQIRQIVAAAPGRPYEAPRRVWILDGVEVGQLGPEAANAFLKTLEEPPAHVVFILLAANPTAVLPTILSRCHQLLLPGTVAMAGRLGAVDGPPELLAMAAAGHPVEELRGRARSAIQAAASGEVLELVRLCRGLADEPLAFQLVSTAALELGIEGEGSEDGRDLVELSGRLLAADGRCRELNLNRQRQLLSHLLSWYREAVQV
jgi:hypothetical protein